MSLSASGSHLALLGALSPDFAKAFSAFTFFFLGLDVDVSVTCVACNLLAPFGGMGC